MQVALYAALRQKAGSKFVEVSTPADATIRDVLTDLTRRHPALGEYVWAKDGSYANIIRIFLNSVDIRELQRLDTPVKPDDSLDIFTPVSGG